MNFLSLLYNPPLSPPPKCVRNPLDFLLIYPPISRLTLLTWFLLRKVCPPHNIESQNFSLQQLSFSFFFPSPEMVTRDHPLDYSFPPVLYLPER